MGSRRRSNSFSRFLEDIVDDTKVFVDDLIDRAKDIEEDTRDSMVDVVKDDDDENEDEKTYSAEEVAALQKTLEDLRAKVEELTALQAKASTGASDAS
jgi:polyhydroxyalkanoate synthesis regulator phasin